MAWSSIGNSSTAAEAAEKLNDMKLGTSVTISLNAARDSFVIWASKGNENPNKHWVPLAEAPSQERLADIMDKNHLEPNCAVVSLDKNNEWQLWGYVGR